MKLLARASRRAAQREAAGKLQTRAEAGRRAVLVSAPLADARFLGISHRVDGPQSHHGDLPGALHSVSGRSRIEEAVEREGVGVSGRRRNRRARIARCHYAAVARKARQPDLRDQLQPAAPRRPGARQWADRAGAGGDFPRLRLERDQSAVGQRLGSAAGQGSRRAAGQAHGRDRRRSVSEVRRRIGRLLTRAFLGRGSEAAGHGAAPQR